LKKDFDVVKVRGLHMVFDKSVLNVRSTIFYNIKNFSKNFVRWRKFHNLMLEFKPDLCISDMEPIVPVLSFWYKVPLVSLDNQHRITNLKLDIPKKYYKDYLVTKAVIYSFVSRANAFIVTSFTNAKITKKNTFIVAPIIRKEVRKLKPKYGDKILVYLTRKNGDVLDVLKKIDEKFIVYGYNVRKRMKNLEFKTPDSFVNDLKNCKAVIATSGFTLMSEAIYLKKPYLALPLKGQFEQMLNSLFLKQAGYGEFSEDLKETEITSFLKNLFKYKSKLKKYKPDFNKLYKVLDRVLKKVEKKRND